MCSGCSYVPVDDIIPPAGEDMIDNIREELNDAA
jgi:hypothetical protein